MTCYEKRDHSGYFIKIKFLAWIDSSVCTESNGASFMDKYLITSGVMTIFIQTGRYTVEPLIMDPLRSGQVPCYQLNLAYIVVIVH